MNEKLLADIKKEFRNKVFHARASLSFDASTSEEAPESNIIWRRNRTGEIASKDEKNTTGYRRFWANMSTPVVDFYNSVVTSEAMRGAFPEWIQGGNARLMHNNMAAGRVFPEDYEVVDGNIRVGISIPLHKEEVLKDIDASLLRGVSIGFWPQWEEDGAIDYDEETGVITYNKIRLAEVSIVDWGATPGTDLREERSTSLDRFVNHVRTSLTGTPNDLEGKEVDEIKEVLKRIAEGIDAMQSKLNEQKASPPEQPPEDKPNKEVEELRAVVEAQAKSLNELRAMLTTEEALAPEVLSDLEKLIKEREEEAERNKDVPVSPFTLGIFRGVNGIIRDPRELLN